jgi:hypothetical protein
MDLTPYVEGIRQQLVTAAEAGGDEAWVLAERLVGPLESATRLALLEALSEAAGEISSDLAPGSVEVRLRGLDPEFVVTAPPAEQPSDRAERLTGAGAGDAMGGLPPVASAPPDDVEAEGEGGTSRITLRLPTHLKPRIDEAAGRAGLSVNAWLVRAVAAALQPADRRPGSDAHPGLTSGRRYRGWVR